MVLKRGFKFRKVWGGGFHWNNEYFNIPLLFRVLARIYLPKHINKSINLIIFCVS